MDSRVPVMVYLPRNQYLALTKAAAAVRPDMQVHTFIEAKIAASFMPKPKPATIEAGVSRLHALGLNDRAIARELQCSHKTVARHRNALHLPANDTRGGSRRKDAA